MGENGLNDELRAMQDIAVALQHLDSQTRGRVLRWILERFQSDLPLLMGSASLAPSALPAALAASEAGVVARRQLSDETLSVESLTDLFPTPGALAIAKTPAPQSITGMLQDLVAEFQDLAREWNGPGAASVEKHRADSVSPAVS